jgi:hypothetical protein
MDKRHDDEHAEAGSEKSNAEIHDRLDHDAALTPYASVNPAVPIRQSDTVRRSTASKAAVTRIKVSKGY